MMATLVIGCAIFVAVIVWIGFGLMREAHTYHDAPEPHGDASLLGRGKP